MSFRQLPGRTVRAVAGVALVVALGTAGVAAATVPDGPGDGPVGAESVAASDAQVFVSMSPLRVLDTRPQFGPIGVPVGKPLGKGQVLNLRFKGAGKPLPQAAVAAVINVTIDADATKKSFMTVWPEGEPRPVSSVNNAEPGFISANSTIAKLGINGGINIYNDDGFVNVVVDLVGYMLPVSEVDGLAGSKFLVGDGAPSASTGAIGDTYFDKSTKDLYGPKTAGGWGSPVANLGGDGTDGADGASFLSGSGAPAAGLGQNGDSYVDTATGTVYKKASGSWSSTGTSLKGPKGDKGDQGDAGATGSAFLTGTTAPTPADGKDGDSWVDVNTGIVYHRTAGTWSPIGASLKGPKGDKGDQGDPGAPGAGAEVGTVTPTGACSPNGQLFVNVNTGDIVVCVSGTWSGGVAVKNTIDGATTYADSGVAPVFTDLDASYRTVATFTAPVPGGTYILDGNTTIGQNALVAVAALANVECAWFDSAGAQAGPASSESAVAQLSLLGTPNTVNLEAKATTVVASTATLRCRFTGVALSLGGFRSTGWSFEATRTA
jgi:hypothetical protein